MSKRAWLMALACLAFAMALLYRHDAGTPPSKAPDDAIAALSASDSAAGFARAEQPREFVFPKDHGPHEDFRSEWWYFTGHLADQTGRAFGFQLTLFRFELAAHVPRSPSAWRTPRVLLGHFAVTDVEGQRFHAYERMSRALPEVAGSTTSPPAAWLDDWRIDNDGAGGWHLHAAQQGHAIDLTLEQASATVLQGDRGLSRKSAAPSNASYYYSVPRLTARGTLTLEDGDHDVSGEAWLDREWSTSALSRQQAGWDWFALQLADGGSLMFYRLRQRDGGSDPFSAGTYVDSAGRQHALTASDVRISALGQWKSPVSGSVYPQGWRLALPAQGLSFELAPRVPDQEWRGRFKYWEGAVTVTRDGQPAGLGYVEMTGY